MGWRALAYPTLRVMASMFDGNALPVQPCTVCEQVASRICAKYLHAAKDNRGRTTSASASGLTDFRQLRDHLDFEVEPIQPRHPDSSQRRVRRFAPVIAYHLPDLFQLGGGIDNEDRDVDNVVERAFSGPQDCIQIVECQPDLRLQIGFGRSVGTAAHLT